MRLNHRQPDARTYAVALLITLALLGWAGLRPFDFARSNPVSWIEPGPGLQFQGLSLAMSGNELRWQDRAQPAHLSIEVWLRAAFAADERIAAAARPATWLLFVDDTRLPPLGLAQEGSDLLVRDAVTNPGGDRWYNDFRVAGAIHPGALQHFVLTSAKDGPQVYVDGSAAEVDGGFGIPIARANEPVGGTLVIGAGPPWDVPWSGQILGLALYDRLLTAEEIAAHARSGPPSGRPASAEVPGLMAIYGFDEHGGAIVHDRTEGRSDLLVPKFYHPPERQRLLAPPNLNGWDTAWYAADVFLNLAGFLCFGFLLARLMQPHLTTMVLLLLVTGIGFALSLTFELTQVLMFTRTSSLQDLLLNTLGAFSGALASSKVAA